MVKDDSIRITMVQRAIDILNYLEAMPGAVGVSEIANQLDLPKATVHRILTTLQDNGLVTKTDQDRYLLGLGVIKLASKVKAQQDQLSVAQPLMAKLAKETGETVNFGVLHQSEVVHVLSEAGEQNILLNRLEPVMPLYCSSGGKLFLADWKKADVKALLNRDLVKRTVYTKTSYDELAPELEQVRQSGIAFDNEEFEYGLSCFACPIRNRAGEVKAALSLSGPTSRIGYKGREALIEKLQATSKRIEDKINQL